MNLSETIHKWILESKSAIVRWMIGITLTAILSIIGIMYSDHNKVSALDIIVRENTDKIDKVVLVPIIQTEQIKNINDKLNSIESRGATTEEKYDNRLNRMEQRQDDIYNIVLEISKRKH